MKIIVSPVGYRMDRASSGAPVVTLTGRKAIMTRWAPLWDFGLCFDVFWPLSPWNKPRKKIKEKNGFFDYTFIKILTSSLQI